MLDISRIFYLDKVSEVFLLNIACETMMMKTKFSFSLTTRHFHVTGKYKSQFQLLQAAHASKAKKANYVSWIHHLNTFEGN